MLKKTISIEGMYCSHCAGLINIQLYGIDEVLDVKVDIGNKNAIVLLKKDVANDDLKSAIEEAGYKVVSIH